MQRGGETRGHRARMVIKTEERERTELREVKKAGARCPSMDQRGAVPKYGTACVTFLPPQKTVHHKVKIKKSKGSSKHKNQRNIKPERNR